MNRIIIVHFSPVELYPPVQNLLSEVSATLLSVTLFTTPVSNPVLTPFRCDSPQIRIIRIGFDHSGKRSSLIRYINYLLFNLIVLFRLISDSPKIVMYFETISALPALIYKRFIKKSVSLYIHYHEYTNSAEYSSGMKLTKYFHQFERKIYSSADWISHTNSFRMKMFTSDIYPISIRNAQLLPNYPPKEWKSKSRKFVELPFRVVYVGALSMDTMYTKEFAEWVVEQCGNVIWDIYSYNFTFEASEFFKNLNCEWVNLKSGIDYHQLPTLLPGYHLGIILYNGHIPNYVYNAPNKLFEYLICGLHVVFSIKMEGSLDYVALDKQPLVKAIDFEKLQDFHWQDFTNADSLPFQERIFERSGALQTLLTDWTRLFD